MPTGGTLHPGLAQSTSSAPAVARLPPSLLPHSTSPFQQRLRSKQSTKPNTKARLSDGRLHLRRDDQDELPLVEELTWTSSTVVWMRGGAVYRSYSFTEDGQEVVQALFADFDEAPLTEDDAQEPVASTSAVTLDSLAAADSFDSAFGPYRIRNPSAWSDDPLPLPTDPPTFERPAACTPQRHLVVIFSHSAVIYPACGGFVPVHCPFRIRRAWALDRGLLLERASDDSPNSDRSRPPGQLPTLWSLSKVLGEVKPVGVPEGGPGSHLEHGTPEAAYERLHNPSQAVIYSSNGRHSVPALVITSNTASHELVIWQYTRRQLPIEEAIDPGAGEVAHTANAPLSADGRHLVAPSRTQPSVASRSGALPAASSPMSRGPSSLSGTKRKHGVSFADPDISGVRNERSVRRASADGRHPRISLARTPMDPEEEMLDALALHSDTRGATALRGSHLPSRWPQPTDRRSSLSRNDLSVTMDRMALSQSGVPFGLGNDLAHETTILLGDAGDPGPPACEISMTAIWSTQLAASLAGQENANVPVVHTFDVRGGKAVVAIDISAEQKTLLLEVETDEIGAASIRLLRQVPAVASVVVRLARAPVEDLLLLKPDGSLALLGAEGAESSIAWSSRELRCLADTVASDPLRQALHTRLLDQDLRLPDSTSSACNEGALMRCMEVLAQVLPSEVIARIGNASIRQGETCLLPRIFQAALLEYTTEGRSLHGKPPPISSSRHYLDESAVNFGDKPLRQLLRVRHSDDTPTEQSNLPPRPHGKLFEAALISLHILAQDLLLRLPDRGTGLEIGRLVARLAAAAGFTGWVEHYRHAYGDHQAVSHTSPAKPEVLPETPPDLLAHLSAILSGRRPAAYPNLPRICENFNLAHRNDGGPASTPTRLTEQITALYEILSPTTSKSSVVRTRAVVQRMAVEYGWTTATLQRLAPHILLPLREALRSCQLDPPDDWPAAAYELAMRPDLARQKSTTAQSEPVMSAPLLQGCASSLRRLAATEENALSATIQDKPLVPVLRATRFNEDRRLEEVSRMLCYDKHCIISAGDRNLEQLTPAIQQSVLVALSQRTMSLPVGSGMFRYRQVEGGDSDEIQIAAINTSARILPMASPVHLADKEPRDPTANAVPDRLEWPDFHAGVAAALQNVHVDNRLDSSKLSFNRPQVLDARHAGLLFGLGLAGHLDTMSSSQAYDYLKAKHDPTSVGILLGLGVSYLGTGDPTVTSVISIHLPALHPPQSSVLNVSGMTQAAAAIALGLVHFASGHRTFSNVLLTELCAIKMTNIEDGAACREAYALSAGFAFGMIMLGRGRNFAENAVSESDHLRVFRSLILGESNHSLPGSHQTGAAVDINITSPAATVAMALMYLRSERKDVAALLAIPDTIRGLDYVRPDLLLLRVISRNMVLWSQVRPTKVWIEAQVPSVLAEQVDRRAAPTTDFEVSRWHVIAGACFAIGLRFAGTASADGHATLIHYLDRLTRASYSKAPSVQARIRRNALRSCLSVVSLSLAMVMAGTGEVNVLRRLRVAHGLFSEGVSYGSHLASHMALGLLFLGGGRYTIGNSDAAIASLLLSLYPAFPATSVENRAHLQAFRHFWVLAVEPRYLEARDVDTNEPVFLPVRLRLRDDPATNSSSGVRVKQLVAPTLLPDLETIDSIQSDSPRYLPFSLPLAQDVVARRKFMRAGMLYAKRRTGHLSYAEDPRGIRSVFTRSKSEAGSTVFDLGEMSSLLASSASNLRDFVKAFSGDVEALSATNCLSAPREQQRPPTAFESFSSSVLLEGLTRDKSDVASIYHAVYSATKALDSEASVASDRSISSREPSTALRLDELHFIVDLYQSGRFKALFGKAMSATSSKAAGHATKASSTTSVREPLLNPAFIVHLSTRLAHIGEHAYLRAQEDGSLAAYLRGDVSTSPPHLGIAVQHLRLPNRAALRVLHGIVTAAKAEHGLDLHGVEAILRRIAAELTHESGPGSTWTNAGTQAMARAWCEGE
ncbi:hypothetical protein JCM10908_007305 [Rhodotorula pacifica]|uniref:anaphase promoting complex subunit 1 n=1 Tax=Rhodotorula pacifica TaxID=1495444 RepID=UPI0031784A99